MRSLFLVPLLLALGCSTISPSPDLDAECEQAYGGAYDGCSVSKEVDGQWICQCCSDTFINGAITKWCRDVGPIP